MKALVGAFNKEKALVGAFSVIVKTGCGTDGSLYSTTANCNRQQDRIFAEHRAHGTETGQDYDNGRHGAPPGLPVKKQDGSSVRKRPGADTGDFPDTNTGIGDGDGDGDGDGETAGALPPQPRAARYNAGFVASGT